MKRTLLHQKILIHIHETSSSSSLPQQQRFIFIKDVYERKVKAKKLKAMKIIKKKLY